MPIFEFKCEECEEGFELLVRRSEEVIACPECGSVKVRKEFSTFASSSRSQGTGRRRSMGTVPSGGCCGGGCGGSH